MKYFIIFLLFIFLLSCTQTKEDVQFKNKFFNNILMIEEIAKLANESVEVDSLFIVSASNALYYNSVLTDSYATMTIEGGNFYLDVFDSVKKEWKNWYKQNKYNMTLKKADSIYFEGFGACQSAYDILYEEGYPTGYISNHECYIKFLEDSLRQEFRKNYK